VVYSINYSSSHNNTYQRSRFAALLLLLLMSGRRRKKGFIIKSKLCVLSFFIQFSRHAQHVVHYLHHHHRTSRQIFILAIFSSLFLTFLSKSQHLQGLILWFASVTPRWCSCPVEFIQINFNFYKKKNRAATQKNSQCMMKWKYV
jgi:hypothetical protein